MRLISRRTRATAVIAAATTALVMAGCGNADPKALETESTKPASPKVTKTSQPAPTTTTSTSTSTTTRPKPSTTTSQYTAPEPTSTRTPEPTRTRTQTQTPSETQTKSRTKTEEPSPSKTTPTDDGKTLALGSSSPRALKAQKRLQSLGYYIPQPDGSFGGGTRQAVWALQKVAGLPRTGQIDPATQKALDNGVTGKPTISSGLEIDIARQVMYAVRGGSLVRTINISSGNGETFRYPTAKDKNGKPTKWATDKATTPKGSFGMYMSRDENWESTLELGSMYRPAYFNDAIAVHGAGNVPAYPASHGCVRVTNATMDWLWANGYQAKGTAVLVR